MIFRQLTEIFYKVNLNIHTNSIQEENLFMSINHKLLETRIRNLCITKGISTNKMLKEAGLSKSVLDNIKRGRNPSSEKILAIATYFDVTTDYLLAKSDTPNPVHCLKEHESSSLRWFREELTKYNITKESKDMADTQLVTALNTLDKLINVAAE